MAVYGSNYVITVDLYRHTEGALAHAEAMVRGALGRAPAEPLVIDGAPLMDADRGETVIGWLAVIPGRATPGPGSATRSIVWQPGTEIPQGATELHCRGKRTV